MFRQLLTSEFAPHRRLTEEQVTLLQAHYDLLLQWNTRLNLTRISSLEDAVRFHYCESLFMGSALPEGPLSIVDVGSGAGFPGIPIGILRPECTVTLVESHQRKAVFLREASRNLPNIKVVTDRAQNLKPIFDWVVSRAVSPTEVLKLKLASHLALLVGDEELSGIERRVAIPWGTSRFLTFHVKHPC